MFQRFEAVEAGLRIRMRAIDPRRDAGNGTLLADAAATLLAADAVAARADDARVSALPDDILDEAMTVIQLLLAATEPAQVELPFGTLAVRHEIGSATVAGQQYVLVERHAGMMREQDAPRGFEGVNLEHLLRLVDQRSKRLACRPLGRPEPVTHQGLIKEYALRFAPCDEAGGVSLEVPLGITPIAWTTHANLIGMADHVVKAMRTFWRQRRRIAARSRECASFFAEAVSSAGPDARGLSLVGMVAQRFQSRPEEQIPLHLLVNSFDEALRPAVCKWPALWGADAPDVIGRMVQEHAWSLARAAEADPIVIDELAAAIAEAASGGPAAALKRLATDLATDVLLPLPDQRTLVTRLHWSCGMIVAHIFPTETVAHASNSFTVFDCRLPETIVDSLVGRTVGEIVELPMACPFPIRHVERQGKRRLRLSFHTDVRPVDFEAGTIGPVKPRAHPALAA